MQSKGDAMAKKSPSIVCVPPHVVQDLWAELGPRLLQGQYSATGDMDTALAAVGDLLLAMPMRKAQIWAVLDGDPIEVIGALSSTIHEADGVKWLWVDGMSGKDLRRWGGDISDRLAEFAATEGCDYVRCAGRRGLERIYRDVYVVGEVDGECLFERAVKPRAAA
jgi:hypothetical protein